MSDSILEQINDLIAAEPEEGKPDEVDQVAELLSGKDLPEEATAVEPGGDTENEEEAAEEEAPEEEAPEGVDYAAEIPMSDGSKVTLGALKDAYQDQQKQVLDIQERENTLMARYSEMQELSQYTQLPPAKLESIRQQQQQYLQKEHELMLQVLPELNDRTQFEASKGRIVTLAKEYGIEEAVGKITDHRIVKLLHDFASLKHQIRTAKDNVKPLRSKDPKARNRAAGKIDAATAAAQKANETGSMADQISAVSALLQ